MTATTPSTALATIKPVFTESERLALAGFLAGYRALTREAYTLDLRQFTAWCRTRSHPTPTRAPRCATTGRAPAWTGTPPGDVPAGCGDSRARELRWTSGAGVWGAYTSAQRGRHLRGYGMLYPVSAIPGC
jgi:hypothetical protein